MHYFFYTILFPWIFTIGFATPIRSYEETTKTRVRRQIGGFDFGMLTSLLGGAMGGAGGGILESALLMLTESGIDTIKMTLSDSLDLMGGQLQELIRNMDPVDFASGMNLFSKPSTPLDPSAPTTSDPLLDMFGTGLNPFSNMLGNPLGNLMNPSSSIGRAQSPVPEGLPPFPNINTDLDSEARSKRSTNYIAPNFAALTVLANSLKTLRNTGNGPSLMDSSLDQNTNDIADKNDRLTRIVELLEELAQQLNS